MPELHGNPFKNELDADVQKLKTELGRARREIGRLKGELRTEQFKNYELSAQVTKMENVARELIALTVPYDYTGDYYGRFKVFLERQEQAPSN
jgi:hypothetical protein